MHDRLAQLAAELDFELTSTDVDAAAAAGNSALRAEFGDRLPVVLLDGREHSYWDVDEPDCAPIWRAGELAHEFGQLPARGLPWK